MTGTDEETPAETADRWAQAEAEYARRHAAVVAPTPAQAGIRNADLVEAIAHIFALQGVLASLEGGVDSELGERYGLLATTLTSCLFEQPEGDLEYATHPLNVKIESRVDELVGEFLLQVAGGGDLDADALSERGTWLLEQARKIRESGSTDPRFRSAELTAGASA